MEIVLLNRSFYPDLEATGQYLAQLAQDLSLQHQVTVICGVPNIEALDGRVFPWRDEKFGTVHVRRAWNPRLPKAIPLARMLNLASFYTFASVAARGLRRADVVIALTDPPFLGLLGAKLARRLGCPFVLYCQDLYPDVAVAVGMAGRLLTSAFAQIHSRILGAAHLIIALGEDMAGRLASKGVAGDRIRVIPNWADTELVRPVKEHNGFRSAHGLSDKLVVMYSGNFGYVWDLDSVLKAAHALRDQREVAFVLIGAGSLRSHVEQRIRSEHLENVLLLPHQPLERLAESLSAADLHVVPMRPGVYGTMVPSKLYGILASGTPMIALAEEASEAGRLVREHGCGWRAEPGDADGIVRVVRMLLRDRSEGLLRGERGRDAAVQFYDRRIATSRFQAELEALVAKSSAGAPQTDGSSPHA